MKFRTLPRLLFGHRAKAKVLIYMLSGAPLGSEREIARLLGISHVAVNKIMRDFEAAGLVTPSSVGGSKIWVVKEDSFSYEKLKGLAALSDPYMDLRLNIKQKLEIWEEWIEFATIYGSFGERREEQGSDIDLLVVLRHVLQVKIHKDEKHQSLEGTEAKELITKALHELSAETLRRYGNRLHPIVIMHSEIKSMEKLVEKARGGILVMP